MFTIERSIRETRQLPVLSKAGIAVLALGALGDLIAHLEAAGHDGHLHAHTSAELSAHLIVFVGMVLIYLGVVLDGARRHRARRSSERT